MKIFKKIIIAVYNIVPKVIVHLKKLLVVVFYTKRLHVDMCLLVQS